MDVTRFQKPRSGRSQLLFSPTPDSVAIVTRACFLHLASCHHGLVEALIPAAASVRPQRLRRHRCELPAPQLRTHDIRKLIRCVQQVEKVVEEEPQSPNLNVKVSVSFPQSEIFGIKLVNGHATEARLSINNNEPTPIGVSIVGGSLSLEQNGESRVVRNLTAQKYSIEIPAGAEETVPYSFTTELHPQDLRLQLIAVLSDNKNGFFTVPVYNETVSVVEAATSFFDPQMYVPTRIFKDYKQFAPSTHHTVCA